MKNRGESLVGVLIAAAIMGVIFLALLSFSKILGKEQLQSSSTFQVDVASRLFVSTLQNSTAWTNTVKDPANQIGSTSLACIANATDCSGKGGNFRLNDASGSPSSPHPLSGWTPATQADGTIAYGVTSSGQSCNSFNSTSGAGSDSCPFALSLTWTPMCPSTGSCIGVPVTVVGAWRYNPASVQRTLAFDSAKYSFQLVPGNLVGSGTLTNCEREVYNRGFMRNLPSSGTWTAATFSNSAGSLVACSVFGNGGFVNEDCTSNQSQTGSLGNQDPPQEGEVGYAAPGFMYLFSYKCSGNKRAISGGCFPGTGNNHLLLRTSWPMPDGWMCIFDEVRGAAGAITYGIGFAVSAICCDP